MNGNQILGLTDIGESDDEVAPGNCSFEMVLGLWKGNVAGGCRVALSQKFENDGSRLWCRNLGGTWHVM